MYAESLTSLHMDYSYRTPDASVETSITALRTWFAQLEKAMLEALNGLSDADLVKIVDRGSLQLPVEFQYMVYREALLIFFAKVSVYLKALEKPLPEQWRYWIS
ncbi:MAG: hypothetical protein HC915_04015 [Anaerolineae bacterium]|nr:hypothetical protein [Anaerolineae bacterium]